MRRSLRPVGLVEAAAGHSRERRSRAAPFWLLVLRARVIVSVRGTGGRAHRHLHFGIVTRPERRERRFEWARSGRPEAGGRMPARRTAKWRSAWSGTKGPCVVLLGHVELARTRKSLQMAALSIAEIARLSLKSARWRSRRLRLRETFALVEFKELSRPLLVLVGCLRKRRVLASAGRRRFSRWRCRCRQLLSVPVARVGGWDRAVRILVGTRGPLLPLALELARHSACEECASFAARSRVLRRLVWHWHAESLNAQRRGRQRYRIAVGSYNENRSRIRVLEAILGYAILFAHTSSSHDTYTFRQRTRRDEVEARKRRGREFGPFDGGTAVVLCAS